MKNLKKLLSSKEYKKYVEIKSKLESGEIKRWVLPNTEEEFDSNVALENFKKVMRSGITQHHIKKMKATYGEA